MKKVFQKACRYLAASMMALVLALSSIPHEAFAADVSQHHDEKQGYVEYEVDLNQFAARALSTGAVSGNIGTLSVTIPARKSYVFGNIVSLNAGSSIPSTAKITKVSVTSQKSSNSDVRYYLEIQRYLNNAWTTNDGTHKWMPTISTKTFNNANPRGTWGISMHATRDTTSSTYNSNYTAKLTKVVLRIDYTY